MQTRHDSSKLRCRIVVVGGANTDYLVRAARLPQAGETVQGDKFESAVP